MAAKSPEKARPRPPQEWVDLQRALGARVQLSDDLARFSMPWTPEAERRPDAPPLTLVAGVDVSFVADTDVAVASCVILSFPSLTVLHKEMLHCRMPLPYVPGYLAFREVLPLQRVLRAARENSGMTPQIVFVDGNGVLHYRRCGLASHLGVVEEIPTVGCAKNILTLDGLTKDSVRARLAEAAEAREADATPARVAKKGKGDPTPVVCPLVGDSGTLWGYAALTGNSTKNPIYVSAGHRIAQESSVRLALTMAPFRVVEPIRQADLLSREYIRENEAKLLKEAEGPAPPLPSLIEMTPAPALPGSDAVAPAPTATTTWAGRAAAPSLPAAAAVPDRRASFEEDGSEVSPRGDVTPRKTRRIVFDTKEAAPAARVSTEENGAKDASAAVEEAATPSRRPFRSDADAESAARATPGRPNAWAKPPVLPVGFPAPDPFCGYHVVAKNVPPTFGERDVMQLLHPKVPVCRGMAFEDGTVSVKGCDVACRYARFCLAAPAAEHKKHVDVLRAWMPVMAGHTIFFDLVKAAAKHP